MINVSIRTIIKHFNKIKFGIDSLLIPFIFILAYSLKFKVGWVFKRVFHIDFGYYYSNAQVEPYLILTIPGMIIWMSSFYFYGLYKRYRGHFAMIDELTDLIKALSLGTIHLMALTMLINTLPGSRMVLLYSWLFGIIILGSVKYWLKKLEHIAFSKQIETKKTIVVGTSSSGQDLIEYITLSPSHQLHYIGSIDQAIPEELNYHIKNKYNHLGTFDNFESIVTQHTPDVICITDLEIQPSLKRDIHTYCQLHNITLLQLSDMTGFIPNTLQIKTIDGIPFITNKKIKPNKCTLLIKHSFDRLIAALLMLILSPLFVIISICIKLKSPNGPIFFSQDRMTKNNRVFQMYKFRTMQNNAEKQSGPVMVNQTHDPRIFKFGKFLRTSSLDELPQLFNILIGDMSFIGPRPERPHFVTKFEKKTPHFSKRHEMKSGITGWAQINGRSYLTSRPNQKLKYDLFYIYNWSLLFDFKIIIKTIIMVLKREQAY